MFFSKSLAVVYEYIDNAIAVLNEAIATKVSWHDRGDNESVDYITANFIRDGNYHDLDLSGVVGVGRRLVLVRLCIEGVYSGRYIWFKTKGNINSINIVERRTQVANISYYTDIWIYTNDAGVIEYNVHSTNINYIHFCIRGWFE